MTTNTNWVYDKLDSIETYGHFYTAEWDDGAFEIATVNLNPDFQHWMNDFVPDSEKVYYAVWYKTPRMESGFSTMNSSPVFCDNLSEAQTLAYGAALYGITE